MRASQGKLEARQLAFPGSVMKRSYHSLGKTSHVERWRPARFASPRDGDGVQSHQPGQDPRLRVRKARGIPAPGPQYRGFLRSNSTRMEREIMKPSENGRPRTGTLTANASGNLKLRAGRTARPPAPHGLTPRETDVIQLLATGRLDKEIASDLRIAVSTVRHHIKNIFRKVHSGNRTEAAMNWRGGDT